ncbi:MAG: peptide deformylase [Desulfuromonadales bacterium]|nr:peptide deformylase [Desulfuromonadales bacterium]
MSLMKIYHYPEPVLAKESEPIIDIDAAIRQLVNDMAETMYAAPGVGLAAPQVGVSKRLIVLDCSGRDEEPQLIAAINPEIIAAQGESFEEEGCLSVPGYYCKVKRNEEVTVCYLDLDGVKQTILADGLLAVAFQHEIDHLNGILFVDRLSPLKRGLFKKKYPKILEQMEEQL